MEVYQTNFSGVFMGTVLADPDPMDEGNWLIPGGCVTTAPPDIPSGHMAVWDGAAWGIVPTPAGLPDPAPTLPPTPDQIRAAASLTKIEFCKALFRHQILSEDSVIETARGKFPPEFEPLIASMPLPDRLDAKLAWIGATHVGRTSPLFLSLLAFHAATNGLDADAAAAFGDALFGIEP